jgi:hypothetical protein
VAAAAVLATFVTDKNGTVIKICLLIRPSASAYSMLPCCIPLNSFVKYASLYPLPFSWLITASASPASILDHDEVAADPSLSYGCCSLQAHIFEGLMLLVAKHVVLILFSSEKVVNMSILTP